MSSEGFKPEWEQDTNEPWSLESEKRHEEQAAFDEQLEGLPEEIIDEIYDEVEFLSSNISLQEQLDNEASRMDLIGYKASLEQLMKNPEKYYRDTTEAMESEIADLVIQGKKIDPLTQGAAEKTSNILQAFKNRSNTTY